MAVATLVRKWTLDEVHRLPDDGNKYELVRGELFVTPPPGMGHETILARLGEILTPYVSAQKLGHVYHPRSVLRFEGSEVEPDLMVRTPHSAPRGNDSDWATAPIPRLVVEVLSPVTRRRDLNQKKELYLDAGVPEYWVVDPESRTVTVLTRGSRVVVIDRMRWSPEGASPPLAFEIAEIFDSGG
jgi:Uma2 family endonuclease